MPRWPSRIEEPTGPDDYFWVLVTHGGAPLTDADHGFLETVVVPLRVPVVELP